MLVRFQLIFEVCMNQRQDFMRFEYECDELKTDEEYFQ